jgi:hypothetical protein
LQSSAISRADGVRQPELRLGAQAMPFEYGSAAFALTDRIELSFEGLQRFGEAESGRPERNPSSPGELDADDKRQLEALKKRDREVRAHEQAHLAAAGGYALGGASYTYEMGPDGQLYAVGGEVPIDVSEVSGDPQATLQKASAISRAALAPADPSSADRAIAARASAMAAHARQELMQEKLEALSDGNGEMNESTDFAIEQTSPMPGEGNGERKNSTPFDIFNALAGYRRPPEPRTMLELMA